MLIVQAKEEFNLLFDLISTLCCFQGTSSCEECSVLRGTVIIIDALPGFVNNYFLVFSNFFQAVFRSLSGLSLAALSQDSLFIIGGKRAVVNSYFSTFLNYFSTHNRWWFAALQATIIIVKSPLANR